MKLLSRSLLTANKPGSRSLFRDSSCGWLAEWPRQISCGILCGLSPLGDQELRVAGGYMKAQELGAESNTVAGRAIQRNSNCNPPPQTIEV